MISSADHQVVTVQMFNDAQAKIEQRFDNLDNNIATIGYETRLNAYDIEHLPSILLEVRRTGHPYRYNRDYHSIAVCASSERKADR